MQYKKKSTKEDNHIEWNLIFSYNQLTVTPFRFTSYTL